MSEHPAGTVYLPALTELAQQINTEHQLCTEALKTGMQPSQETAKTLDCIYAKTHNQGISGRSSRSYSNRGRDCSPTRRGPHHGRCVPEPHAAITGDGGTACKMATATRCTTSRLCRPVGAGPW